MGLDESVRKGIKDDMSLTERIGLYIPLYKGYKEKNLRREEDRAVRNEMARAIQAVKADLANVQRGLVSQPDLMIEADRLRSKVDRYEVEVRKAVNGYSGFHAAVKILEDDLDRLVKWDAAIMEDIQALKTSAEDLLRCVDMGTEAAGMLRALERDVDKMMEDYSKRETVMRGFAQEDEN